MRTPCAQRGFSLVEVLIVCVIGMVIFGATMTAFTSFYGQNHAVENQRDNVENARMALDTVSRQLRNLANPSGVTATINRAQPYDFIFQTSDPARTWVRYCVDTTGAGASTSQAKLWQAESVNPTPPAAMTGTCGASGAGVTWKVVSQNISNETGGADRPAFSFACLSGSPTTCPASSAEYPKITMVSAQLYVDANPSDRVREMQITTGVFLRNQNQAPVAIVGDPPVTLAPHRLMLNATGSYDPEGRALDFHWYMDSAPPSPFNCSSPGADLWSGPTFTQDFGTGTTDQQHQVWLVVCDPGGLSSTYGPKTVTVP